MMHTGYILTSKRLGWSVEAHYGGVDDDAIVTVFYPAAFTLRKTLLFRFALQWLTEKVNRKSSAGNARIALLPHSQLFLVQNSWLAIKHGAKLCTPWRNVGPFEEDIQPYVFASTQRSKCKARRRVWMFHRLREIILGWGYYRCDWAFISSKDTDGLGSISRQIRVNIFNLGTSPSNTGEFISTGAVTPITLHK